MVDTRITASGEGVVGHPITRRSQYVSIAVTFIKFCLPPELRIAWNKKKQMILFQNKSYKPLTKVLEKHQFWAFSETFFSFPSGRVRIPT